MSTLRIILNLIENKNDKVIVKEKQEDKKNKITSLQDKAPVNQVLSNSGEQLLSREVLTIDAKSSLKPLEGTIYTIIVR